MSKSRFTIRQLTTAAIIAAIYAALTLLLPIPQYGGVQLRVAEAMTVLPFFFPEAIPGLAVGCFLSNLLGSPYVLDWIFGTLATLLAALWTSRIKHRALAPLPPVVCNAVIVGHRLLRAGRAAAAGAGAGPRPQARLMRSLGSAKRRGPFFIPGNFFLLPSWPLPSP